MGRDATPTAAGRHVTFGPDRRSWKAWMRRGRDRYVDWLRALSLVVVIWHWAFTIVDWRAAGRGVVAEPPAGRHRAIAVHAAGDLSLRAAVEPLG